MRDGAGSSANGQGDGGAAVVEGVGMFAGAVAICGVEDAGDVDEAGGAVRDAFAIAAVGVNVCVQVGGIGVEDTVTSASVGDGVGIEAMRP